MCRQDIINFIAEELDIDADNIEEVLNNLFDKYKSKCCKDLVEEALEIYTIEEYNACRVFFEFLLKGEGNE